MDAGSRQCSRESLSNVHAGYRYPHLYCQTQTIVCVQTAGKLKPGQLSMSVITFAELIYGAKKSRQQEANLARLNELSELIEIRAFGRPAADIYGDVRSSLEACGQIIGGNDLLIAAHALSLDLILVTNNEREFSRVSGLQVENWVS